MRKRRMEADAKGVEKSAETEINGFFFFKNGGRGRRLKLRKKGMKSFYSASE